MNVQVALEKAPVPSHIAADRVVDFDYYNDRRYAEKGDMHDALIALIDEAPGIFWSPYYGGHWVIIGHELLFNACRDTETFSSSKMSIPPMEHEPTQIPINLDPPIHAIYRQPLMKAFSPKAMKALEGDIRALAIELIEKVADKGACDFVPSVAEPLPVMIFMKLMGMPLDRLNEFRVWVHDVLSNDMARRVAAYNNVAQLMASLIKERQAKREDDLISRLLDFDIEGRAITFEEMQAYCLLLFIAGLDTVANGMAYGVRHLARDPELQARLRAQPALIPEAAEELLRRYTFTIPGRIVMKDVEFGGAQLRAGERVVLMLPAGDLDPKAFPNPTSFDLDRENKVHIAFNSGPHRCVGSHLARIELKVLYEEWLKRVPEFHKDPDKPERFHGANVLAIDSLPLVWTAA